MKSKIENLFKQFNVRGVACDTRRLQEGDAFFAIKGSKYDGNDFIQEALKKSAVVFTDNPQNEGEGVFYLPAVRLALAVAAGIIYSRLPNNLIAVTGTNGKSSVVSYVYQILKLLGEEAASIGTIGVESTVKIRQSFIKTLPPSLTTADPVTLRKILNELARSKIQYAAIEASSHGIEQRRLGDLPVRVAAFTGFSQDHLDYHGTMEDYLKAKLELFKDNLVPGGEAVINSEIFTSAYAGLVKNFFKKNNIAYCLVGKDGDIKITDIEPSLEGARVYFEYNGTNYQFHTNIVGSFQAVNLLIAAKIVANIGFDFARVINVIEQVEAVSGRLQRAGTPADDFHVFVDYAHTPDALGKSLSELQKIKANGGKLYIVFGCGGERDVAKRFLMGKIACELADYVLVTDDNPRGEEPGRIRHDILQGAACGEEIAGREAAIANAVAKLQKNDILLIAGKGHETYQITGDVISFFSDIKTAKKWIKTRKNNFKKINK